MIDYQKAVDDFYALKPASYGLLKLITLSQSVDPETCAARVDITVQLLSSPDAGAKYLSLDCRGARDIRINASWLGLMLIQHYLVDIRSVRGDGLEGLNYRVAEEEEALFSFACKSFTAQICD